MVLCKTRNEPISTVLLLSTIIGNHNLLSHAPFFSDYNWSIADFLIFLIKLYKFNKNEYSPTRIVSQVLTQVW